MISYFLAFGAFFHIFRGHSTSSTGVLVNKAIMVNYEYSIVVQAIKLLLAHNFCAIRLY